MRGSLNWSRKHQYLESQRKLHGLSLPSVESASYICVVDEWDEFIVGAAFEIPIAFAQVDVDLDLVLDGRHVDFFSS